MKEVPHAVDNRSLVEKEVGKIRLLSSIINRPELFLYAQNMLLYGGSTQFYQETDINPLGLPSETDNFYHREEHDLPHITGLLPRILNIGSGSESSRKLAAINIDISPKGKPDVIANAQHLPFRNNAFSVVRASHVLEHIPQNQLGETLNEWKRVLHNDGELQIAVPDADITFQEIIGGTTPKGKPAFSLTESTAPLAQIYGLGYDNPGTDKRWLHKIIFSYALLDFYLKGVNFAQVSRRTHQEDLAYHCGVDDDSQNHYTLLASARNERFPHEVSGPLTERAFNEECQKFKERCHIIPAALFVIPVHNEERSLPHFLTSLEYSSNLIGAQREFIFVVNGCTDNSEEIIRQYISGSFLDMKLTSSEKGIVKAFRTGIEARNIQGFVGKLDADTLLHPHSLDLMSMFLVEHSNVQVTYSEPMPIDSQFPYNEAEHNPIIRSKRLYLHGRTSLYREDPFATITNQDILHTIQVEDMFLSFYFAYFYGLESIAKTPHALVYSKTVKNLDDLVTQIARSASEMARIFDAYPSFKILEKLLEREIYPSQYKQIVEEAKRQTPETINEWTQLKSTK